MDKPETPYLYRPISHYNGAVLKCAGIATPESRRIVEGKSSAGERGYLPGVVEVPRYLGDRITAGTLEPFTSR